MTQHRIILYGVFLLSGISGLVYEILWMRYFQLLFGNTAKASAIVLAVFFFGMGLGSWLGARLANWVKNPLAAYGWTEIGIGLAAAPAVFLIPLYQHLMSLVLADATSTSLYADVIRLLLAATMTLPAATLLGATLPLMGTVVITSRPELGRQAGRLYGFNTLGAACGVILTGFVLPPAIGISSTYATALAINILVGALILIWAAPRANRAAVPSPSDRERRTASRPPHARDAALPRWLLLTLALGSGAGLIALEVLWTRMFALVFQNSVYSFSAIVLTVLVGLSVSALLIAAVIRRTAQPVFLLGLALAIAAISIALTPALFTRATGLAYFAYGVGWPAYLYRVIGLVAGLLLVPVICAGATLPFVWSLFARHEHPVGMTIGLINVWNLAGAVLGAVAAGFLVIPTIGLWAGITGIAGLFLLLALLTLWHGAPASARPAAAIAAVAFGLLTVFVANPSAYSVQRLKNGERLLYLDEGEDAAVSVVEDAAATRWLKSNNTYSLGATSSVIGQKRLGLLPLLLHPAPRDVAFIGVGTGISMSAALDQPLTKLVGVEILPGVLDAASYFSRENGRIFANPRVSVVRGDGRVYLRATNQTFDVIVSDLFIPWHAGTGSLYTVEHFAASRKRLNPGGLYCQWLPLYQMSEQEVGTIAATFARAFPHVSIWRSDFSSAIPIIGLVGSDNPIELDASVLGSRLEHVGDATTHDPLLRNFSDLTLFYAGDLKPLGAWLNGFPINTDDHPVIEFQAPINQAEQRLFNHGALAAFYHRVETANSSAPVSERSLLARAEAAAAPVAVSPAAGNLLFQVVVARDDHNLMGQLAAVGQAMEQTTGRDMLSTINLVLNSTDDRPTRGVVLDQGTSR